MLMKQPEFQASNIRTFLSHKLSTVKYLTNFDFLPKVPFQTKHPILDQTCDFRPNLRF